MRSFANLSPTITTEIKTPAEASQALCDPGRNWLSDLREMRGGVLYHERGHNSIFLFPSGTYCDADPFDAHAYHILFRVAGCIAACARVSMLNRNVPGYLSTMLGNRRFEEILSHMGIPWEGTCEASRWIVAWEFRSLGLGPRVVAAAWEFAQSMKMQSAFVLAGTHYGQDRLLCRMGARPVEGVPLIPASVMDDESRLLHFNICKPAHMTVKRMSARTPLPDFRTNAGLIPREVTLPWTA